jgi:MFS family permease
VTFGLPRAVFLFGLVSLCNDAASDMILPLLPAFLTLTLGAGPAALGLIEGTAEAASSLLKLWAGRAGDRGVSRKGLAVGGYAASNLARPLIGLAGAWTAVLALRFADRVGKGLRTAPRDAMLSAQVGPALRGRAFGLHRAMDHAGAMLGPLAAAGLLALGLPMREVFVASAVPGALAVAVLAFGLREVRPPAPAGAPPPLRWRLLPPGLRLLVTAVSLLTLVAVPDAFLLLWVTQAGVHVAAIPLVWTGLQAVRTLTAWPGGWFADRVGRIPVVAVGWLVRAAALAGLAVSPSLAAGVACLAAYAGATAVTEGAERAFIGDRAPAPLLGTAYGLYHMNVGLLSLPAALWLGWVWGAFGAPTACGVSAALTLPLGALLIRAAGRARGAAAA